MYSQLVSWIMSLVTHTGVYGNGQKGFVDISSYLGAWQFMFTQYWFLIVFAVLVFILAFAGLFINKERKHAFFMLVVSGVILLQLGIIAKHFDEHYLVVAFNSFSALFVLFYLRFGQKNVFIQRGILVLVLVSALHSMMIVSQYMLRLDKQTKGVVSFNNRIHSKYPNSIYIGSYLKAPICNSEYALFMGNDSSKAAENEELSALYPDYFSFFADSRDISGSCTWGLYHFKKHVWSEDLLRKYPRIIFINSGYDFDASPFITKPLEDGPYSRAWIMVGTTEREADHYFDAALQALEQGDERRGFALALKAHELHYQPEGKVEYLLSILYKDLKR
ncbi:MAG: hypothetical protein HQL13_07985 [Candidatus Omnitrophica bacterium]|nr:hypothetical protein [Candidatus Omnitrophota bacterium]